MKKNNLYTIGAVALGLAAAFFVYRKFVNGKKDLTTTAATISASVAIKIGVHVKAPLTNTDTIYIGSNTLATTPSDGFPLEPGESIFIEIDNPNKIYARSASTGQKVTYLAS